MSLMSLHYLREVLPSDILKLNYRCTVATLVNRGRPNNYYYEWLSEIGVAPVPHR